MAPFAPRTNLPGRALKPERKIKRRYFIATEGLSEIKYMRGIKDIVKSQNNSETYIDLTILEREKSIQDMSDPIFNMTYLRDYVRAVTHSDENGDQTITGALLVASVLTGLYLNNEETMRNSGSKKRNEIFRTLTEQVENSIACDEKRLVIDLDKASELIRKYLSSIGVDNSYLDNFKFPSYKKHTFIDGRDKLCLIVDRDYCKKREGQNFEARDRDYYNRLLKLCRKDNDNEDELRKIDLYVTNPCIEFWFLLHFDELMIHDKKYPEEELMKNRKEQNKKNYVENILNQVYMEHFGIPYDKTKINFEKCLHPGIHKAMNNVHSFQERLDLLENHLGTNMHYLLKELGL